MFRRFYTAAIGFLSGAMGMAMVYDYKLEQINMAFENQAGFVTPFSVKLFCFLLFVMFTILLIVIKNDNKEK